MHKSLLWACCLWMHIAAAQEPAYMHYTVRDGLPGNLVYSCTQDRRGLLWFGTDKGLACFDGLRFHTYGVADGLPDPEVLRVKEDSKGRLWIFCFQKSPCYMENGRIVTAAEDTILARMNFITGTNTMSEDGRGGRWHIQPARTVYYVNQNGVFLHHPPDMIFSLQPVGSDFLAFGAVKIMRIGPAQEIEVIYQMTGANGVPSAAVSKNRILYSFPNKVTLLNDKKRRTESGRSLFIDANKILLLSYENGHIKQLDSLEQPTGQAFTDRSGRFWIYSTTSGATCFDNDRQDLSHSTVFLPGKKISGMFEDNQGTLWFCTVDEGVFALPRHTPVIYGKDKFPSLNIRSLACDASGKLFIGDNLGNVHVLKGEAMRTVVLNPLQQYNQVRQILPVGSDAFWAVADDDLYFCDRNYNRLTKNYRKFSLKSAVIQDDKVWFASSTQLGYIHIGSWLNQIVIPHRFTAIESDETGNIWAGDINGLYSQRDRFQYNWGEQFPALKGKITNIRKAGKNQLYLTTPKDGLIRATVTAGAVSAVEVINEGLAHPIDNIQSLFVEPSGKVWMATNRGVYGLGLDGGLVHFDAHNGLSDDDVNSVLVRNDTLWAGTVSGLTRLILRLPEQHGDFATHITDLHYQLSNRKVSLHLLDSLSGRNEVMLPNDAANVELNLAGLDYNSRSNLRFSVVQHQGLLPFYWWTLDNLIAQFSHRMSLPGDSLWAEGGVFQLGAYLPPGYYLVQVTAIGSSGVRSQFPATWTIIKPPHWYEIIWFYVFLWIAIGYVAWRIYQDRLAYQRVRAMASTLQLQTLQAQINPHFIGNAVNAIQQFLHPPDPVKASEYIALFMQVLRQTMHFSAETFVSFAEEISYLREYLHLNQLRFEDRLSYEITGEDQIPKDVLIPTMLLQPVVENATIHGIAPEGSSVIRLHFSRVGSQLRCELTDNGLGYQETQRQKRLAGISRPSKGLLLLQQKIESLNVLYDIDMQFSIQDLAEQDPAQSGTQVIFTYYPDRICKATKQ